MRPEDKKMYIEYVKRNCSLRASHINCSICSECGGKCCKKGGCGLMTCDVPEMTVEGIQRMLDTGKYSITFFWAEFTIIPVMSAREVDSDRVNNSIIRRPCALQKEDGCPFSDEERPTLGLLYMPKRNHKCELLVDSFEIAADWYNYKPILDEVVFKETGKTTKKLFLDGCIQAASEIHQKIENRKELTDIDIVALEIIDMVGISPILEEML